MQVESREGLAQLDSIAAVESLAHRYLEHGALLVAVDLDTILLATQTSALAARFGRTQ